MSLESSILINFLRGVLLAVAELSRTQGSGCQPTIIIIIVLRLPETFSESLLDSWLSLRSVHACIYDELLNSMLRDPLLIAPRDLRK